MQHWCSNLSCDSGFDYGVLAASLLAQHGPTYQYKAETPAAAEHARHLIFGQMHDFADDYERVLHVGHCLPA
eukprot:3149499-Karenia_brevis.AAC.1